MLVTKFIAFALIVSALFWSMSELFSFDGLLYMGEQWRWLATFFTAILASVIMAWMLACRQKDANPETEQITSETSMFRLS